MKQITTHLTFTLIFFLIIINQITAQDYATFSEPFGGEYYKSGITQNITWTSSQSGTAKLEYTIDGGDNWMLIGEGIDLSSGSTSWDIPEVITTNCYLKITSEENDSNFSTSYPFSIGNRSVLSQILVNESYEDWSDLADLSLTSPETSSQYGLKAINDDEFLYVYFETAETYSLQNVVKYVVYLDTDNDNSTGKQVNGIGAEIEFSFGSRRGTAYLDNNEFDIGAGDLNLVSAPTVWSDRFEITFQRDASISGNLVFSSDHIKIVFENEDDNSFLPSEQGGAGYHFKDYTFEELPEYSFTKTNDNHLRIVSHNVEFDGLFENDRLTAYDRIYAAMKPNIIAFQEIYNHSDNQIADRFEGILPSSQGEQWNVRQIADCGVATRYTIKEVYSVGGFGNGGFVLDLRPAFDTDVLVISAHPSCCDNDPSRQREVDAMMAFIKDAKTEGGQLTIPENTPIIITGDMNFVGDPQQITTLVTGDIVDENTYGEDFDPDWNDAPFIDSKPYVNSYPMVFTQGNPRNPGNYSQGRLDFIIYSGSVLDLKNSYVLYSESLPQDSLSTYNLLEGDCKTASDHYPVVADFALQAETEDNSILVLRENNENGEPIHLETIKTVKGIVTVSDEFGADGPAFIQDEEAAISIFGSDLISQFQTGDEITLTTEVGFFNGLTQLIYDAETSNVLVHQNTNLPNSQTVTIPNILGQDWNAFELLESKLVKLNKIQFTSTGTFEANTNYEVTDGNDVFTIRIDGETNLVGTNIPEGQLTIKGILSQFDNVTPYSEGYQVLPRNISDITAYESTDIAILELRNNDSQGISIYEGQFKTISGTITVSNEFGNNGPAYIQDHQAGIAIFGSEFISQFSTGDSVTLSGDVNQFNGTTQMTYNADLSEVIYHQKASLPEAEIVTISEILNQEWNGAELLEGKLLELEHITFTNSGIFQGNTTYQITDGTQNLEIRIDENIDLIGQPIPVIPCAVTGVLSQFDSSIPYSEGYQLNLRSISDINIVTPASNPSPANNTTNVSVNTTISWDNASDVESVDLYFGPNSTPQTKVLDMVNTNSYTPPTLDFGTTYFWKVVTKSSKGYTVSGIWSFTTESGITALEDEILQKLVVSPNPTSGLLNITWPSDLKGSLSLKLMDLSGKEIKLEHSIENESIQMDVSGMQKGLYLLYIQSSSGVTVRKVLIE